jgi:hypothetical protein
VRFVVALLAIAGCQRAEAPSGPVDCNGVGETLAQFEVGNYAPPEQRAAVVSKHRQACEASGVTADQVECLTRAKDTWAARACFPKMFPGKPGSDDCGTAATRMREAVMSQVGSNGSAAAARLDTMLPIVKASCEQDQWPAAVVRCIVGGKPGDMAAFQACTNQLPQDMQQKMGQRLQQAIAAPPPSAPPPAPQ